MCPGIDCVGIITSVGSSAIKSGLDLGDRVAALSLNGCTAKYVKLKIDDVIKVPDDVDSAEAVVVLQTYSAAFQCLLTNVDGMNRYSRKPLKNDKVLVVGPFGVFERAVVELAFYLGARKVYFSCIARDQPSYDTSIRMLGAKPLSMDPDDWSDNLEGMIDIAIETSCLDRYEHSYRSLTEDGILVPTGMHETDKNNDWFSGIEKGWVKTWAAMNPKCFPYDGIVESYLQDRKQYMVSNNVYDPYIMKFILCH
jgi:NADPH:quinone reductase-like Zn-dependent oxidoreductase